MAKCFTNALQELCLRMRNVERHWSEYFSVNFFSFPSESHWRDISLALVIISQVAFHCKVGAGLTGRNVNKAFLSWKLLNKSEKELLPPKLLGHSFLKKLTKHHSVIHWNRKLPEDVIVSENWKACYILSMYINSIQQLWWGLIQK